MGMGSCFKSGNTNPSQGPPKGGNNNKTIESAQKDRITEQDRAILDIKARMKKLKIYVDKMVI